MMKMKFSTDELHEMVREAEQSFIQTVADLGELRGDSLTLQELRSARNAVFFKTYDGVITTIEENGWSYDFEFLGRFSRSLHQTLESVWLEYIR